MRLISRRYFIGGRGRYVERPPTEPSLPPLSLLPLQSIPCLTLFLSVSLYLYLASHCPETPPLASTAINKEGVPVTGQLDRTLSGEIVKFTGSEPGRSFNEAF